MVLQTLWFILVFVLLAGYAILDGFDLGVGMLHLTGKTDNERRVGLNAIAPVWDGNEVWLITGGGALFAAFPFVYATVFSAMYLPLMLVLVALIGRAVSVEFRSKVELPAWRRFWDWTFFLGSLLPSILFGVAFGNILHGLPLSQRNGQLLYTGGFFTLLNPYSIMIGVLSCLLFLLHGAIFLAIKSQAQQHERMRKLIPAIWMLVVVVYVGASIISMLRLPYLFDRASANPLFWVLSALVMASMLVIPIAAFARHFGKAFIASSTMIGSMMFLAALSLYPSLVPSSTSLTNSLNIRDHSSSPYTLKVMLIIAGIGMPCVIAYTAIIYRVFRGKTEVPVDGY